MTINTPGVNAWRNVAIGIMLTLATMASSWLIVGKGWLQTRGEDERQITVNTERLTKLEDNQKYQITREEHQQLIDRLTRLESIVPTRTELESSNATRDVMLKALSEQLQGDTGALEGLKIQIARLEQELSDHDRNEKTRLQEPRQP